MLEQKRPRDFLEYAMADNLRLLEELTGFHDYPSTRSLPPIIYGARYGPLQQYYCFYISYEWAGPNFWLNFSLDEYGIERLKSIEGVVVHVSEDDD